MDYLCKPASRILLRSYAQSLRKMFDFSNDCRIDVISMLDRVPDVLHGVRCDVLEDSALPKNVPAATTLLPNGEMIIKIKDSTYQHALRGSGGYRSHIVHEICHAFLIKQGHRPLIARKFNDGEIPAYRAAEWQAKALCGEVMMPYEATKGMTAEEIADKYQVSLAAAQQRLRY